LVLRRYWTNACQSCAIKHSCTTGKERRTRVPMFRDAYRLRRRILPVDGFHEWMTTKCTKQPFAIAMKNSDLGELAQSARRMGAQGRRYP